MDLNLNSLHRAMRTLALFLLVACLPLSMLFGQSDEDCMMCHEDIEMEGMLQWQDRIHVCGYLDL